MHFASEAYTLEAFSKKRVHEQHADAVKRARRINYKAEERREARKEAYGKNTATQLEVETPKTQLERFRLSWLLEISEKKRLEEQKLAKIRARDYQVWPQSTFPAVLADRCITVLKSMPKPNKERLEKRWPLR